MEAVKIVLLCILSAIGYGVIHDQITARVCVEYFTVGHPPVLDTTDPTLLGLGWGVIATWWAGLLLGVPLAMAARAGRRPPRSAASLVRTILALLGVMAACALASGVAGRLLAQSGAVVIADPYLVERLPAERVVPFLTALWAHSASYLVGFGGGLVVIVRTWSSRRRRGAG